MQRIKYWVVRCSCSGKGTLWTFAVDDCSWFFLVGGPWTLIVQQLSDKWWWHRQFLEIYVRGPRLNKFILLKGWEGCPSKINHVSSKKNHISYVPTFFFAIMSWWWWTPKHMRHSMFQHCSKWTLETIVGQTAFGTWFSAFSLSHDTVKSHGTPAIPQGMPRAIWWNHPLNHKPTRGMSGTWSWSIYRLCHSFIQSFL